MADFIEVKTNFSGKEIKKFLKRKNSRINRRLRTKLRESAEYIREKIANYAPERTGNLKKLIRNLPVTNVRKRGFKFIQNKGSMEISLNLGSRRDKVILWVNRGTGIYGPRRRLIKPKRADFMVIRFDGKIIRKKTVKGQKPQRFVERGLRASKLIVVTKIKSALKG